MYYCISFSQELQRVYYFTFWDETEAKVFVAAFSSSIKTNREEADEDNHPTKILHDNEDVNKEAEKKGTNKKTDRKENTCNEEDSFDEEESC